MLYANPTATQLCIACTPLAGQPSSESNNTTAQVHLDPPKLLSVLIIIWHAKIAISKHTTKHFSIHYTKDFRGRIENEQG